LCKEVVFVYFIMSIELRLTPIVFCFFLVEEAHTVFFYMLQLKINN